jgi:hypothetical protein
MKILSLVAAMLALMVCESAHAGRFRTVGTAEVVPVPNGANVNRGDPLAQLLGSEGELPNVDQLGIDIRIKEVRDGKPLGDVPENVSADVLNRQAQYACGREQRGWMHLCYQWEATNLFTQPLYFEDWNLERYGYSPKFLRIAQPALSAGRFYLTIITLPYQMAVHPPREPVATLGYYRPGSPAPYRFSRPEVRLTAGVVATGFWMGVLLLIQ